MATNKLTKRNHFNITNDAWCGQTRVRHIIILKWHVLWLRNTCSVHLWASFLTSFLFELSDILYNLVNFVQRFGNRAQRATSDTHEALPYTWSLFTTCTQSFGLIANIFAWHIALVFSSWLDRKSFKRVRSTTNRLLCDRGGLRTYTSKSNSWKLN